MKRRVTQLTGFAKKVDGLLKRRQLLGDDLEKFKSVLAENPDSGDLIAGTGGIRKIRLKSASKGKRGGFRICYYYDAEKEEIFLMQIYGKNEQENISAEQKKALRNLIEIMKE